MIAGKASVTVTPNLGGERWSNFADNAMRTAAPAATGLSGTARDRHDAIRRFSIRVGGEAVRVGQALGYALEPIGTLDPDRLARAAEGDRAALDAVETALLALSNSSGRSDLQRPSMAQDMLKGRRTEIEQMNGYIVQQARRIGLAAPANAALTEAVKRVERGELAAGPEVLAGL